MTQYKAVARYALKSCAVLIAASIAACAATPSTDAQSAPAASAPAPYVAPREVRPANDFDDASSYSSVPLRDNAPLRYVVKKGDTLWGIANRYLADPWQWPELWYVNGQLKNPHKIYPGDVLELYNVNGRTLLARGADLERLSPQVRESLLGDDLPAIPIDAIRSFLKGPRVVDIDSLNRAPYILDFADEHIIGAANMKVFVKNLQGKATTYSTVRQGTVYKDPDTGELLGYEAIPSGKIEIKAFGTPADGVLTESRHEILPGDRLLPPEAENFQANFFPHVPVNAINGKIISVYQGVSEITQYQIVAINRGMKHGLEPGHVLRIKQAPREVKDPITGKREVLPAVDSGLLMVFKAMSNISYGLILEANRSIHILDGVENPTPGSLGK